MMQPSSLYQSSFNDELIMAPSKGCLTMTDMWAMELGAVGGPLRLVARALPDPGPGELLVKVTACGVYRTALNIVDGAGTEIGRASGRAVSGQDVELWVAAEY